MEMKHVCKFCKKSFPCGRSLGGHIRSHLNHNNNNHNNSSTHHHQHHHHHHAPNEEHQQQQQQPELLKSGSYELRENPKKTWRVVAASNDHDHDHDYDDDDDDNHHHDHMFLHSSPSSSRSGIAGNNNNSYSSVSEVVEPEQEEIAIAMCLIMLSKDVGPWGKVNISSSVACQFDKKLSLLQENNCGKRRIRREKIQGKDSVSGVASYNSGKKSKKLENSASGCLQNGSEMKEFGVSANGFASNDESNKLSECKRKLESASASGYLKNGSKMKENEVSENGYASNDQKNKAHESNKNKELSFDENTMVSSKLLFNGNNNNNNNSKRSKFECATCNKVFHSYQALGGHRASHKKVVAAKNSPVSKLELDDGDFLSPPADKNHHHQQQQQQQEVVLEVGSGNSGSTSSSSKKVVQKHECPICLRVFPSGQALGGHKRSHLLAANNIANSSSNNNNDNNNIEDGVTEEKKPSKSEIRDLLDLNLPPVAAAAEEGKATNDAVTTSNTSSSSLAGFIKPYWWVESSHKHDPLLGLISN